MHTSGKPRKGKITDFSLRGRERERERGGRVGDRDALGLTTCKHTLICVKIEATADKGEKDKRQYKCNAPLK